MYNNIYKNKYLRYTNSESADDENDNEFTESENNSRNIDIIVNKLEDKLNNNFINKLTSQNQETTRTSKMNESNMNNLSDLFVKNIKNKDNENSIDISDSLYSVNSINKSIKFGKSSLDIDISMNNNDLKELQNKEHNNEIKNINLIQTTNNSNNNISNFNNMNNKNNLLSRNKILNTGSSLNTLSNYMDNSRYFLNKTNSNLIISNKIIKKNKNENINNKDKKIELNLKEDKENKKNDIINKQNNKSNKVKNKYNNKCFHKIKCSFKIRNKIKCKKCNFITLLRNIFLTIIILSALGFYILVFLFS